MISAFEIFFHTRVQTFTMPKKTPMFCSANARYSLLAKCATTILISFETSMSQNSSLKCMKEITQNFK